MTIMTVILECNLQRKKANTVTRTMITRSVYYARRLTKRLKLKILFSSDGDGGGKLWRSVKALIKRSKAGRSFQKKDLYKPSLRDSPSIYVHTRGRTIERSKLLTLQDEKRRSIVHPSYSSFRVEPMKEEESEDIEFSNDYSSSSNSSSNNSSSNSSSSSSSRVVVVVVVVVVCISNLNKAIESVRRRMKMKIDSIWFQRTVLFGIIVAIASGILHDYVDYQSQNRKKERTKRNIPENVFDIRNIFFFSIID
ncbi:hypothetical protein V1477_010720 [Vespula maculifrons]|uniref:Uncharacterized protein n=1 Tax=Vespula maculifrons TaxID=7453 RepID=A0ABD2C2R6_VESMC